MITATNHPLPFERLSPQDFERLCLWLAKREQYEQVELIGPSGNDRGLDLLAWKNGIRVGFQCKRRKVFGPSAAKAAVEAVIRSRPPAERPDKLILVVAVNVGDAARRQAERTAEGMDCDFWAGAELDELVKKYPDVLREFFQVASPLEPSASARDIHTSHSGVMMPPKRPAHYLERSGYLGTLGEALLSEGGEPVGISGQGRVGVQGMGGIGKTVLASAVLEEPAIGLAFSDGVHWITVGQDPDLLRLLRELSFSVGGHDIALRSIHMAKLALSRILIDRRVLLVLDDVWDLDHANALDVVGPRGRLLITTRDRKVLSGLGAEEIRVDLLSEAQALELLARWAHRSVADLPPRATEIVRECGRLPLALAMIGAMVELAPSSWETALERLKRADLGRLRRAFPDYPYPDLLKALAASVDALPEADRDRYLELTVFPPDAAVPRDAILTLWEGSGLDRFDGQELLARFEALSLLQATTSDQITLHDLQADFLRHQVEDLSGLHRRLARAYEWKCDDGFSTGPDDGYFFERLPWHLARGDLPGRLEELLFDFPWLHAKLKATEINSLLSDYGYLLRVDGARAEASAVQGSLRLAAHVLVQDPGQLAGQLLGRLTPELGPRVARLLAGCASLPSDPWLRPLRPTLRAPGGSLLRTLEGHTGWVTAVADLGDGRVVSGATDKTLRIWDIESGATLHVLEGHESDIKAVAAMGSQRVASVARDQTLRIWDAESGKLLRSIESPTSWMSGLTDVTALDAERVATASEDGLLRLWDASTGALIRTFEGHDEGISTVLALGGERIVSGARDQTLRVWDVEEKNPLYILKGHTASVRSLARLGEGRVISASNDKTLRIWDIERGELLRTLENDHSECRRIVALADGRVLSINASLKVWDLKAPQRWKLLHGHTSYLLAATVLGDGRVVSTSADTTLRVWDVDTPERSLHRGLEEYEEEIQVVDRLSHRQIVSATYETVHVSWLDQDSRDSEGYPLPRVLGSASIGSSFTSISTDPNLEVWEFAHGRDLLGLQGVEEIEDAEKIGKRTSYFRAMASLGDGRIAVASGETLEVWDLRSGKKVRDLEGHRFRVRGLALLGDGRLVSASSDRSLYIWDVENGQVLQILEGHTDDVVAVITLSDDRLVSASDDTTLRVWNARTGQCLRILEGHADKVTGVAAFDHQLIVSASADSTLRVWNTDTGTCETRFFLDAPASSLAILNDHRTVVTGHLLDGTHLLKLEWS